MEKPTFAVDSLYHIYNRGVEKRTIFLENGDYFRFIHNIHLNPLELFLPHYLVLILAKGFLL